MSFCTFLFTVNFFNNMTIHVRCHHLFQKPSPYRLLLKNNNPYFRIVLYGCETWSVTRREEHRLKVCEDRVLRETTEGNRMVGTAVALRNIRWAGHVARRHKRNVQERKLEGKAHLQVVSKEGTSISCVQLTAQYRNQRAWQ